MHILEQIEYFKEKESLEKAMRIYVMGVHQPLIARNADNDVTFLSVLCELRGELLCFFFD